VAIDIPPRVALANTPTPLRPVTRLSDSLGVEVLVKQDDMTGVELSGNKVRKLEFLLADAVAQGADTIITCGGEQSNHCRATAGAAARLGLSSRLVLRTRDPNRPPVTQGNILLDRLFGADVQWIDHSDWTDRHSVLARYAEEVDRAGGQPYVIPEGGSNALGSWGYVRAAEELANDLAGLPKKKTTLVCATGSGGTQAGLLLGAKMHDLDLTIVGINVCDSRAYFVEQIGAIGREFKSKYGGPSIEDNEINIIEGYMGLGYAKSRHEELSLIAGLARGEGLLLDPVYTGKAFFAMIQELGKDSARFGERIVFLHTGGIFGLFPVADRLSHASSGLN